MLGLFLSVIFRRAKNRQLSEANADAAPGSPGAQPDQRNARLLRHPADNPAGVRLDPARSPVATLNQATACCASAY